MQQTEIFVPKSLAMALKKAGFNEPCVGYYLDIMDDDSTLPHLLTNYINNSKIYNTEECTAPTYDQVVGWFASKGIEIDICGESEMTEYSTDVWIKGEVNNGAWMPQRQQSLLTAFEEALKLI
jgi:hypothetical protein